ncbi:MAG: carbonic anhydrase [Terracidiphilus sp.]|jgi:carbonic anhydrase
MQKLIEGHKRFLAEVFPAKKSHFHLLAESQAPAWLFITCADSRVVPDLILGTEPGDLFIARSIGNVVPNSNSDLAGPDGACLDAALEIADGVTATIEYSVEVLKVRHAIVCGHSDCGAMKAALDRKSLANLPKARRWLDHVEAAFAHRQPLNAADGESAELASLIRGNVVAQLMNLHAQPPVARAEAEGRLTVHGWYYDILTGRIEEYDEKLEKFVALADSIPRCDS